MKFIFSIAFIGLLLITLLIGCLCCEEKHSKSGRKLLSHFPEIRDHYHDFQRNPKSVAGLLNAKQDSKDKSFTMYKLGNKDDAVNTLPKPHRTKKKGHRKKKHRKVFSHQTPPMIIGDQGNLVTGAISNQHYYYQLTDTAE